MLNFFSRKFSDRILSSLPDHATSVLLGEGVGIFLIIDTVGVVREGPVFVFSVFLLKYSIIFLLLLFRFFLSLLFFVVGSGGGREGGDVSALEGHDCGDGSGVPRELELSGGREDLSMHFIGWRFPIGGGSGVGGGGGRDCASSELVVGGGAGGGSVDLSMLCEGRFPIRVSEG